MGDAERSLPVPEHCDVCCSTNIELTTNDVVYGELYGEWPQIYLCHDCKSYVGTHKGTTTPLGRMANQRTRRLRVAVHKVFDKLWLEKLMTRSNAYNWLALQLKIDPQECHISWLNDEQLVEAAAISAEHLRLNHKALIRRKAKKDAKNAKRVKRELEHIDRKKATGKPKFARYS
jgi:hypothetical protein